MLNVKETYTRTFVSTCLILIPAARALLLLHLLLNSPQHVAPHICYRVTSVMRQELLTLS